MDKNFIIGMVLIFLILFVWQAFSPKPPAPATQEGQQTATPGAATAAPATAGAPATATTPATAAPGTPAAVIQPEVAPVGAAASGGPAIAAAPPIEVAGEFVHAAFTNVGGRIKSWKLQKFMDKAGPGGAPLEMVSLPDSGKLPLATYWVGTGPTISDQDTYEVVSNDPKKIVFTRTNPTGFTVTKTIEPNLQDYSVKMTVKIENHGQTPAQGQLTVSDYQEIKTFPTGFFAPKPDVYNYVAYVAGSLKKTEIHKAAGEPPYPANVIWAGFDSIYFFSAVAPSVSENTQSQAIASKAPGDPVTATVTEPSATIPPGGETTFEFFAYLGPKAEGPLTAANHNFDQALDFGWFTVIAKPLVRFLVLLYNWTGNWGIAIIIVTILIKIATLPLTQKSYKSMKAMSVLQPELTKLREKFKDDREKLNQETMALYKAHGVNPASGCLPMLIQLPIFIAFYRALYGTIELRHSPFMFWIHDLSAPDPYYVLPIIMGVSMLITQKMTPSSADPVQQKVMLIMPVVFTFMFLNFPAGLVVYWLVNNILTIAQQMYLKRGDPGAKPQAAAPAKA